MIGWIDSALGELAPQRLVTDALRECPIEACNVVVLSVGKAAEAMAQGALAALGAKVKRVVIAGPDGGHPIPNQASYDAGQRLLEAATQAGRGEHVLALISGGGSALAEVPTPGLSTTEVAAAYRTFFNCGLPIDSINVVRKFISAIKGGRLARAANPATVSSLIISDVVSGDPSAVASGPTIANRSSATVALELARTLELSESIIRVIGSAEIETSPMPRGGYQVLADNSALVAAVAKRARAAGCVVQVNSRAFHGAVASVATALRDQFACAPPGSFLIAGGEPTVVVPSGAPPGGRMHHLALSLAEAIANQPSSGVLAISSDGVDGESGGRGAFLESDVARHLVESADLKSALAAGAATPLLRSHGASIEARPSGHNLADLVLLFR